MRAVTTTTTTVDGETVGVVERLELAWAGDELWVVNTLFSCLAGVDARYSFVPRWRPPFVSRMAAEDRCHLNGMAMRDGRPEGATVNDVLLSCVAGAIGAYLRAKGDDPGGFNLLAGIRFWF